MGCECNQTSVFGVFESPVEQDGVYSYAWDWTSFGAGLIGGAMIVILGLYGTTTYLLPAIRPK